MYPICSQSGSASSRRICPQIDSIRGRPRRKSRSQSSVPLRTGFAGSELHTRLMPGKGATSSTLAAPGRPARSAPPYWRRCCRSCRHRHHRRGRRPGVPGLVCPNRCRHRCQVLALGLRGVGPSSTGRASPGLQHCVGHATSRCPCSGSSRRGHSCGRRCCRQCLGWPHDARLPGASRGSLQPSPPQPKWPQGCLCKLSCRGRRHRPVAHQRDCDSRIGQRGSYLDWQAQLGNPAAPKSARRRPLWQPGAVCPATRHWHKRLGAAQGLLPHNHQPRHHCCTERLQNAAQRFAIVHGPCAQTAVSLRGTQSPGAVSRSGLSGCR